MWSIPKSFTISMATHRVGEAGVKVKVVSNRDGACAGINSEEGGCAQVETGEPIHDRTLKHIYNHVRQDRSKLNVDNTLQFNYQ